jgi:hypothetical protein
MARACVAVDRQTWGMSTKDQILSSTLHGEALLSAKRLELLP